MTYTAKAFNGGVVIETTETDNPKDIKQMFKRYVSELIANPSMDRLGGMK